MNSVPFSPVPGLQKAVLGLSLVLTLAGCSKVEVPATATTESPAVVSEMQPLTLVSGAIEPGRGIKEVQLGQSRAEVERTLGGPSAQDANEFVKGQTYLLFHSQGIELTLQDDKVEMITLHGEDKDWKPYTGATVDGLGVSSTAKEVTASLGKPSDEAPRALLYPEKGVLFRFDVDRQADGTNARVESLSVVAAEASTAP